MVSAPRQCAIPLGITDYDRVDRATASKRTAEGVSGNEDKVPVSNAFAVLRLGFHKNDDNVECFLFHGGISYRSANLTRHMPSSLTPDLDIEDAGEKFDIDALGNNRFGCRFLSFSRDDHRVHS